MNHWMTISFIAGHVKEGKITMLKTVTTAGRGTAEWLIIIRIFAFFQFDHFPKSKIDFENRFEMRMSIFLF